MNIKPKTVRQMLAAAVRMELVDLDGILEIAAECFGDADAILYRLDDIAEAQQHTNFELRASWIKLRNAIRHYECDENRGPIGDDPYGFKWEARSRATDAFNRHGIDLSWDE